MAFEYGGKIYLNLEEQVEVNSRMAVDAKETAEAAEAAVDNKADKTYVDTELAKKVTKQTTTSPVYRLYAYNSNGDTGITTVQSGNATTEPTADNQIPITTAGKIRVATPTGNYHAANKKYVDDGFVAKQTTTSTAKRAYVYDNNGDTNIVISADNANGGTIVQRTGAGRIVCNDPNAAGQAATKNYVDNGFIAKVTGNNRVYTNDANGTPTSLEYSATVKANTIPVRSAAGNVYTASPTSDAHAATKKYVDDNFFQKAVVTPSLSTYQDINGYTWKGLYTAMQNAGAAPIYLNNSDRWLHFGTNPVDTICSQIVTFIFDEILGNKFFFVLKYIKEQSGTQTIQEIQCTITSAGLITAATI